MKTTSASLSDDVLSARDTLQQEANALLQLANDLDESFSRALDVIQSRFPGKLIITGVGKPGHVSKKLAATFASTGTPAFFVHPGEASHGDLGMVGDNDTVLMLSKTGESKELRDMINHCKRFSIPLIAMTQKPDSTLGLQADIVLRMPDLPEACPNQQAPTTSTTVMMAWGDAIAVALMKRRGFTATDFRTFHPGGKLGGQLLSVQSIMKSGDALPLIDQHADIEKLLKTIADKGFGCAIATDDKGHLAGFITDGDIRRHVNSDLMSQHVSDVMIRTPHSIGHDQLAAAALAMMNKHHITQLVILDGQKPVGLIHIHDLLEAGVA